MATNDYSRSIANAINKYLTEKDWKFMFFEDAGIFKFGLEIPGNLRKVDYNILVGRTNVSVLASCPIKVDETDEKKLQTMAFFLTRANYGMKMGCFELDLRDGEIRFKVFCYCEDERISENALREAIACAAAMYKKYAPGILGILFADMNDKDAIDRCENDMAEYIGALRELQEAIKQEETEAKPVETASESDASSVPQDSKLSAFRAMLEQMRAQHTAESDKTKE